MLQRLGDILYYELKKTNKGLADKAQEMKTIKTWDLVFKNYCPEHCEKTMAMSFKKGVLNVAALTQEAADAIVFCRPRIMEGMNSELGKHTVFWINCET